MTTLRVLQQILGPGIPVLCYHQVRPNSGMTPQKFGKQLDLLRRLGFRTTSLARLHRIITGRERQQEPLVVITFDDCTVDNWIHAVPELLRRDMTAAFFAITDFLVPGSIRPRADQGVSVKPVSDFGTIMRQALAGHCDGFMNHAELRTLVHDLGMEVYAHSAAHQACFTCRKDEGFLSDNKHWSHGPLLGLDAAGNTHVHPVGSAYAHNGFGLDWSGQELAIGSREERLRLCLDDFASSRRRLETILDQPCPFLCLPWGQHDDITLAAARQAGFTTVLTLDAGYTGLGSDPNRIGRLAVKDRKGMPWLAAKTILMALRPLARLTRKDQP